ncbi:hypothetical protein GCM10022209_35320 [Chitinophaga oryziterrae]
MAQLLDAELPVTSVRYGWLLRFMVVVMLVVMFSLKGGNVSKVSLKGKNGVSQNVNNEPDIVINNKREPSFINTDTISEINKNHLSDKSKAEILKRDNKNEKEIISDRDNENKKGVTSIKVESIENRNKKEELTGMKNKREISGRGNKSEKGITERIDKSNKKELTGTNNNKHKRKKQKEDFTTDANQHSFAGSPSLSPGSPWIYGSSAGFSPAVLSLFTLPLSKEDPKRLMHKDMQISLLQTPAKKDLPKLKTWSFWVQLNTPVPLSNSKYYFSDPKGNNRFYRNLIPSIRIEKAIGKSTISADLQPFSSRLLPFSFSSSKPDSLGQGDTLGLHTNKAMVKQFGAGVTLQYHYLLYKNWDISAGVGANWWYKGSFLKEDTISIATTDNWKKYPHLALTGVVELNYNLNKWQAGLRTAIPFNKYTTDPVQYVRKPIQLEFLIRRKIR